MFRCYRLLFLRELCGVMLFACACLLAGGFESLMAEETETDEPRVLWTSSGIQGTPEPPPPYRVEVAFPDLKFRQPVTLTNAPNCDRLFVVELGGKVFSFDPDSSQEKDQFVDLKQIVPKLAHTYGMTFHPDYPEQPYVYICYVLGGTDPDGSVIARFTVDTTDVPRVLPESERILLRWLAGGHNGCSLKFGPDGFLYISTGDGTGPNPPDILLAGQDVSNLLSAILRIDVDREENDKNYAIPSDNPFVDLEGARPEIWAYGFRNPWKMSFDRETGDLWVGDVGWDTWELIFRIERGGNYGWSITEGTQPVHPDSEPGPTPILPPITQHDHAEARSITGGFVYRGQQYPELRGAYVYGDFATGKIWALRFDGKQVTDRWELADTPLQIIGWGETNDGDLYVMDYDRTNQIYHLVPNDVEFQESTFPRLLSETGLFESLEEHRPAAGVSHYDVNTPYWADGTEAERLLALPGESQISGGLRGRWQFPEGAVVARTVLMPLGEKTRRLETQILHHHQGEWRPYTYVWNEGQDEAILAPPEGMDLVVESDEGPRQWRVASRAECKLCHAPVFGSVLGLNWWQANRPEENGSQLERWFAEGLLQQAPEVKEEERRMVDPYDSSYSLESRARSYLHSNCVHCHQPGGVGASVIHLDFGRELEDNLIVGKKPAHGAMGLSNASIVSPSHPFRSVLFYRMAKQGAGRMPHVGVSVTDRQGLKLIHDWIASLQPDESAPPDTLTPLLKQLTDGDENKQEEILQQLLDTPDGVLGVTWLLYSDSLEPSLRQRLVTAAGQRQESHLRDLVEPFLPQDQRKKRLGVGFDPELVLGREGDVRRGRELYWNSTHVQCRSCHQVFGNGGDLGPALSNIGSKHGKPELLREIISPSEKIDEKFQASVVETADGRTFSGRVMRRDEQQVELKTIDQERFLFDTEEIEDISPSRVSLMPEQLFRDLDAQEAADLLAYLMSLR